MDNLNYTFEIDRIENVNNTDWVRFKHPDMTHRFGWFLVNGQIVIGGQSRGNPSKMVSILDSYIRAINFSFNNDATGCKSKSVIRFNSIEEANVFLNSMFALIANNIEYYYISSTLLSNKYKLNKVLVICNHDKGFKFLKVNNDFTLTEIDYRQQYEANHKDPEKDMYFYNFDTMTTEANTNNPIWVKNL